MPVMIGPSKDPIAIPSFCKKNCLLKENCTFFAPNTRKRGTLRTLILRAHAICSTKELLDQEINHLQHVFVTFNGYPKWVILQVLNKVEIDLSTTSSTKNQQPDTHTHIRSSSHRKKGKANTR